MRNGLHLLAAGTTIAFAGAAVARETIVYRYDELGRLKRVDRSGSANAGVGAEYACDPADNRAYVGVGGANAAAPATVTGGGFEAPDITTYAYRPTASFTGNSGLAANRSAWGFNPAPEGDQIAFLQNGDPAASISLQVAGMTPGKAYSASFFLSARPLYAGNPVTLAPGRPSDRHVRSADPRLHPRDQRRLHRARGHGQPDLHRDGLGRQHGDRHRRSDRLARGAAVMRGALAALAAWWLAAPACAQDKAAAPLVGIPADKYMIAPGGVDMRTGRYAYSETDLAIGPLALTRILAADIPGHAEPFGNLSHNWDVMLSEVRVHIDQPQYPTGPDYRVFVHFGGRSQTYQAYGGAGYNFVQVSDGPHAPLTFVGDKASPSVVYTYTAADGTVATFRPLGNYDCSSVRRCAFVSEIIEPDGTKLSFDYAPTGATTSGAMRLARVVSSRGYAMLLEGNGPRVEKACVVNLAHRALPADGLCPPDAAASASYTYANLDRWRLTAVKGADGGTSRFTFAQGANGTTATLAMGFVKPGQTDPWLVNTLSTRTDDEGVHHETVDRQDGPARRAAPPAPSPATRSSPPTITARRPGPATCCCAARR